MTEAQKKQIIEEWEAFQLNPFASILAIAGRVGLPVETVVHHFNILTRAKDKQRHPQASRARKSRRGK